MVLAFARSVRFAVVAILAALAGCAAPAPSARSPVFSADAAEEVFTVGFASIVARYIDPVSVEKLALDGLRGFGAIDPAMTVIREDTTISALASGMTVVSRPVPAANDPQSWGRLTTEIAVAARAHSAELAAADAEKIYEAVFDGALARLDVFSRYAGAEEASRNRARRDGYGGIGLRFNIVEGVVRITSVLPETPAERAGIQKNDHITHIGDLPVAGMDSAEISRHLRGPVHSRVTLTVLRDGAPKPLRFALERTHIVPQTVTAHVRDRVLYLKISNFNQETAAGVEATVMKAKRDLGRNFRGVVLDLRGNPGGILKQATRVADLFLAQGRMVSTDGRHPDSVQIYEASGQDIADGRPIAVLMDGRSASAAEIVASALQDRDRAVVIGTSSYGKGTVQTVIRLPNEGEITLTWSRLVAPSGYVLHGLGVMPNICTSGLVAGDEKSVARALRRAEKDAATLAAWRRAGFVDEKRSHKLRSACPAEANEHAGIEAEVALRLLREPALFQRTMARSAATAEARR
jgi:carboxyl-terminal processing protease